MAIKHSKYRNTGILFELLVRRTTADLLNNQDSKAVKILNKHFTNTELGNSTEPQLYNLADDPGETKNLAAAFPDKVNEMKALLEKIKQK